MTGPAGCGCRRSTGAVCRLAAWSGSHQLLQILIGGTHGLSHLLTCGAERVWERSLPAKLLAPSRALSRTSSAPPQAPFLQEEMGTAIGRGRPRSPVRFPAPAPATLRPARCPGAAR